MNLALEMRSITKEFPGVRALSGVSLQVRAKEIHALCGENGAGKSTLMKVLSGYYPEGSYSGDIILEDKKQVFRSIKDSEGAGISIIHQELSLIPEMSVGENIFIGREPKWLGVINWDSVYSSSKKLLESMGLNISPYEKIKNLGVGQQQLVEIAKALNQNPKILVLDEPTSALTKSETQKLLSILKQLRDVKGVSSILITHKLNEIFEVADRITIIRDGKSISTYDIKKVEEHNVIADMVGREVKDLYPRSARTFGEVAFEVKHLTAENPKVPGKLLLKDLNFSVRRGEVLGISGLMGAGRTEMLSAIFGALPGVHKGKILIAGKAAKIKSPRDAIEQGLSLLTEDRKRYGLVLEDSIAHNMTLSSLPKISHMGFIQDVQEFLKANHYRRQLRVKTNSLFNLVKNLSGGNQQKVVFAKCLMTEPKVLFLDEPTRGVDVGAKAEIYEIIDQLALQGLAVVMVSSELPEILGVCDRILVMNEGRISGEFQTTEATQEKIMAAATAFQ